ncbi:MAG: zinc ribbon domain-containing protein [SAR324 cluster bacterium]|nr:zinc ribbon domain-containing protein [SAR324 cluster bacterium]
MKCTHCGFINKLDAKWCKHCKINLQSDNALMQSVTILHPSDNKSAIDASPDEQETKIPNPKLSKCKTCGQEVSKNATTCPHCGEQNPVKTKSSGCLLIIVGFIVFLFIVGLFSKNNNGGSSASAQVHCESFVKKNLKAPSTAQFASYSEVKISGYGDGPWTVIGYVDAQNSFGAKIRSTYTCTIHYSGDKIYLDNLQIF